MVKSCYKRFGELETGIVKKVGYEWGEELPTPTAADRGKTFLLLGGEGVADVLYVCIKNDSNEYEYVTFTVS